MIVCEQVRIVKEVEGMRDRVNVITHSECEDILVKLQNPAPQF